MSNNTQDGPCFENYVFLMKETTKRRKFSNSMDPELEQILLGDPRNSPRESDITSSSELEHAKTPSGTMERNARDLARMDLKCDWSSCVKNH